jgi:uncharacterized protein (UPF0264 family)
LVSVRSADEALAALAGGADVIDVKEPSRGALGAAGSATIAEVIQAVAGRVPATAAAGELVDFRPAHPSPIEGVALIKFGLAGCASRIGWQAEWRRAIETLSRDAQPAAVVYADWQAAGAPDRDAVLLAAIELGCPALLVDTWGKRSGTLFDHWPGDDLATFVSLVRDQGLIVALAGSLSSSDIHEAASLGANFIAVRGSACVGGRDGAVSRERVAALRETLVAEAASPLFL